MVGVCRFGWVAVADGSAELAVGAVGVTGQARPRACCTLGAFLFREGDNFSCWEDFLVG